MSSGSSPDERKEGLEVYSTRLPAVGKPAPSVWYELEEEELDLRQYIAVIMRRKWTVLAVLVIVLFTASLSVFTQVPLYRATATVEISNTRPNITPFRNDTRPQYWYQARQYINSQMEVLKSKALAMRVVERLDLENHPEYFEVPQRRFASLNPRVLLGRITGFIRGTIGKVTRFIFAPPKREWEKGEAAVQGQNLSEKEMLAMMVLGGLSVSPVMKESNVISVSYVSPYPSVAAKVVNAAVEEFVRLDMDRNIQAARLGKRYLEREIAKVQARLEDSEEKLNDFVKKHDLVLLNKVSTGHGESDLISTSLSGIIQGLNDVHARKIQLESLYRQSLKNPDDLPQIRADQMISSLKQELAALESKYANMSSTFTKEYPGMKRLAKQIAEVKRQIRKEKKKILSSIQEEYLTVAKQDELLKKSLEEEKKKATELKRKAIDYNILKREVDTNQRIYSMLLQRAKEMEVQAGAVISNIKPVDAAVVPRMPFSPRKGRALTLALLVGLMAGVFLSFLLEYLDNTIKSPDEAERLLRLPVLGVVPSITFKKVKGDEKSDRMVELYSVESPKSPAAEAFRLVRTSLLLTTAGQPPKTVLVTSPQVGGGKSLVALNLAISYAQMGAKVMLVDADLRRCRLHRILNLKASPGLSNYLAGRVDLGQVICKADGIIGDGVSMDFIPAGTIPPNPVELINSETFAHMLEYLKESCDHIIIDSPPLIGFADALVLSRLVDGTVLVVRSEQTPRPSARHAMDLLRQVGGRILGVVVNDVQVERGSYYYGKYSYYQYYNKYYEYGSSPELPGGTGTDG